MIISPQIQTLNALFGIGNEQFVIPSYQRRYSWSRKNILALFQDINLLSHLPDDDDGHFFGSLLLHSSNPYSIFNQLEVVDGQQRLTTLTILLKSIEKAYRRMGYIEMSTSINSKLLKSVHFRGGMLITNNKLVLGNLDQLDYDNIMSETEGEFSNIKLQDAMIYMDELVNNFERNGLDEFFEKLTNISQIVRLDVANVKHAYKLFETINNRGAQLSKTDIIKNLLFGHASKINDDNILLQVKQIWAEIISELDGLNNNKTDVFFRRYFCSLLKRKITDNTLVDEFKNYYYHNVEGAQLMGIFNATTIRTLANNDENNDENEVNFNIEENGNLIDIITFINKIKSASKAYRKLAKADYASRHEFTIKKEVQILNKIECEPSYIFLMQFMQLDIDSALKVDVIKIISALMMRRNTCKYTTGEIDQIYSNLVNTLDLVGQPDFLNNFKNAILQRENCYPNNNEFLDKLRSFKFTGNSENRARVILEKYNDAVMINIHDELALENPQAVHLEHIIPQTIDTQRAITQFGNWIEYLGDNREDVLLNHKNNVSKIGNLTLIADELNTGASNNPFNAKKEYYERSSILISRNLCDYAQFKFQELEDRTFQISAFAVQHWEIEI